MADKVRERQGDRRSLASKPFEELDETAGRDERGTPLAAAKRAAGTAAAAALAGALAGAAKAFADRRSADSEQRPEDDVTEGEAGEEGEESAPAQETDSAQERDDEPAEQEEPEAEAQASGGQHEQDARAEAAGSSDPQESDHDGPNEPGDTDTKGASGSTAASIVQQARGHLHDLLGAEAESVSALQRSNGKWTITLEAVEVHRVPESTDVLASYDVVLDDDGGIVSLVKTKRYRRSQVEGER